MKKTILLLGAVGVLMMAGCANEGITTDYGEWVATSEYSMDGTTENYRTIEADATAEKTEAASEKETAAETESQDAQNTIGNATARASYTVKVGDTLAGISQMYYGTTEKVQEICSLNGITDEDPILPGQKILLP